MKERASLFTQKLPRLNRPSASALRPNSKQDVSGERKANPKKSIDLRGVLLARGVMQSHNEEDIQVIPHAKRKGNRQAIKTVQMGDKENNYKLTSCKQSYSLKNKLSSNVTPIAQYNHPLHQPPIQKIRTFSLSRPIRNVKPLSPHPLTMRTHKPTGVNAETLEQRKESHLNAYYNNRKNKLKEITKANKKIYVRINSQKSLYSNSDLNKSYESNCSLSRRLSQSKLSRKSQSVATSKICCRIKKQEKPLVIWSQSINQIQVKDMAKFANIFVKNSKKEQQYGPKKENEQSKLKRNLQKIVEQLSAGLPCLRRK